MLEELRGSGITSVLCEGGSTLAGSLLEEDVVERLYAFVAPRLLGQDGVPAFLVASPLESARWRTSRIAQLGNDALLMLDREREA
jgi:diaminohydroxyphosphoribosylaminopyrimidine deaminase/5-amino-6-(5-phosphoribosylamino)uracil reductase